LWLLSWLCLDGPAIDRKLTEKCCPIEDVKKSDEEHERGGNDERRYIYFLKILRRIILYQPAPDSPSNLV
jgi:hypothetical protein